MIEFDQKLIRRMAGKVYRKYVSGSDHEARLTLDDLIHAGVVGFLDAKKKLKPELTDNPEGYVRTRIWGSMIDLVRRQALVTMPQVPYTRLKELLRVQRVLQASGKEAGVESLAAKLSWTRKEVEDLLASIPRVFSADYSPDEGGDGGDSFFDTLKIEGNRSPQLDSTLRKEISELIEYCMQKLREPRQRLVLVARFLEDIRLKELADRFGCTLQAIHYQEKQALGQMRACLEKNGWQWDESDESWL